VSGGGAEGVELGLVSSRTRPGGNLTGVVNVTVDLAAKRLEILREIVPRASRIAVLLDPGYPITAGIWKSSLEASHKLNLKLDPVEVRTASGLPAALNAMWTRRADAGLILPSIITLDHGPRSQNSCALAFRRCSPFQTVTYTSADLSHTGPTITINGDKQRCVWTKSSRARGPPICQYSSRLNSSWLSTSRLPRPSASRSRRRCWRGRIR